LSKELQSPKIQMEYHQDLFLRSLTSCYQTIKQTYRKILGSWMLFCGEENTYALEKY